MLRFPVITAQKARGLLLGAIAGSCIACAPKPECFACLDTFVVYAQGHGAWLRDGYDLEVDADGIVHHCSTGGMANVGDPSITCGDQKGAPQIKLQGGDGETPVLRIGFWRAIPARVKVTLRLDGAPVAERSFAPKYEEVSRGLTCTPCNSAPNAMWQLNL